MNRDRHMMPRRILPELVEIGDDIEVTLKPDHGVTTTVRGIVGKRMDTGKTRYYMTEEGSTLLAWEPHTTKISRVVIHSRLIKQNETLFESDLMTELKKRIA